MNQTVTIRYSRDGKLYYVVDFDFHRPENWLALEKGEDDKYAAWPFAFYEIKSGREEQVATDHELVTRYAECEGWPTIGTPEYGKRLAHYSKSMWSQMEDHKKSVAYYQRQVEMCDALEARHMEIATSVTPPTGQAPSSGESK